MELGSREGEIIIKLKKTKTGHVTMEGKKRSFDKERAGQDGGGAGSKRQWLGEASGEVISCQGARGSVTRKANHAHIMRKNILEGRGMSRP